MKVRKLALSVLLGVSFALTTFAAPPQAKSDAKPTFASVLDSAFNRTEKAVVPAADAMPDDKYTFVPATTLGEFKGVRDFGSEVKHIAVANYAYGASILGAKPPVDLGSGPNGPDSIKSKADIVKFLNDSFTYAHKAINSITEANILEPIKPPFGSGTTTRLALAVGLSAHPYDHYGQMVEYLRMNSIIPPASRK